MQSFSQSQTYHNNSIFFKRNLMKQEKKEWCISSLKQNNSQPKLLYPAKLSFVCVVGVWFELRASYLQSSGSTTWATPPVLSFKIEGEIKTLHNKHKLKQFMTTKIGLQKIAKGIQTQKKRMIHISMRVWK
jgi:hypothetical protein